LEKQMSLSRSNAVLRNILEFLMDQMGRSSLNLRFEDFGMPAENEPFFDGMVVWALREGLISLQASENLANAHTEHSYARLRAPAITSFGMAVYAYALREMEGNILQATAFMKNAEHFGGSSGGSRASGGGSGRSPQNGAAPIGRAGMRGIEGAGMQPLRIDRIPAPPRPR
jgi:hypothetical protein